MDFESEFNSKFEQLCNGIPNNQYIFEVTKQCKDIKRLFFINNCTNEKIYIPITAEITIRDFLFSHNSGPVQIIKPVYPMPCKIVYRIYFDDGHTHGNTACELKTFV